MRYDTFNLHNLQAENRKNWEQHDIYSEIHDICGKPRPQIGAYPESVDSLKSIAISASEHIQNAQTMGI